MLVDSHNSVKYSNFFVKIRSNAQMSFHFKFEYLLQASLVAAQTFSRSECIKIISMYHDSDLQLLGEEAAWR